jgi:hypothetical protein
VRHIACGLHGPQPVSFGDSAARLEQAAARVSRLPDVVLYSVEPGPNESCPMQFASCACCRKPARSRPISPVSLARLAKPKRFRSAARKLTTKGKPKARSYRALWASTRVLELMADPTGNRAAAATSSRYHLVTPSAAPWCSEPSSNTTKAVSRP